MERAGDILKNLLDEEGKRNARFFHSLFRGWRRIAGTSLAEHSRIYDLRNKLLLVEVDHPGWLQRLLFRKGTILRQLKELYPELDIRDLKGKVVLDFSSYEETSPWEASQEEGSGEVDRSEKPVSGKEPVVGKEPEAGSAKVRDEIDHLVSRVEARELRDRLRRLFLGLMEREKSKEAGGSASRERGDREGNSKSG